MELNKIIKKVLRETVGVPDNIVETSELIYTQIMDELRGFDMNDNVRDTISFELNGDYRISDFKFNTIEMEIQIHEINEVDTPQLAGMAFLFAAEFDNELLVIKHKPSEDVVELQISIAVPDDDNQNNSEIIKLFNEEKNKIIESLSHELMHVYDNYKKPISNVADSSSYHAYKGIRFGIKSIDDFMFNLYFIHSIENIVRPSEVVADLKLGNIQRDEFLEFLKNNRVYQILKKINNFSYEEFKKDLLEDADTIRLRLNQSGIDDIPENDEELIEKILDLLMININNGKITEFKDTMTTDMFENFFGFNGRKEQVFRNYIKKVQKYKNHNDFFRNEEKMFKKITNNLIRKIHKLYSLIKHKQTNESIIDWDLHHKINKTPTIFESENQYTPENRKLKLIQNYLDNILVPGNELICDAKVYFLTKTEQYTINLWVNYDENSPIIMDVYDDLVDTTWDGIYNMFEISVSIQRVKSEC
jgi:hypothetical protein